MKIGLKLSWLDLQITGTIFVMFNFVYKVLRSFTYAYQGFVSVLGERNMRVHVVGAIFAIWLGAFFHISKTEWYVVMILIAAVFALEMLNTAIEELANIVRDELKLSYKATKRARDIAAGAVFVMAIVATIIGTMIFLPRILN